MSEKEEQISPSERTSRKPIKSSNPKLIRLDSPKYYTRSVQIRADQGYGVGRTTLVKRWTITTPNVVATMKINGVPIILDGLDGRTFDIAFIRNALRDVLPMTSEENMLCAAEATLFGTQLLAIEYYRYFPTSFLFNLLFTGELQVTFIPKSVNGDIPDKIDVDEECAFSEVQLIQKLNAGSTLDDLDIDSRDTGYAVSV